MPRSQVFSPRFLIRLIGFILLLVFFTSPGFAMPSHVLFIRHAEEPVPEGRELSKKTSPFAFTWRQALKRCDAEVS